MPDPIFESFQQPVDVAPPDVREIRRRGDRRRRRTAIATVAGAAVAIAVAVAPVAALTSGDEKSAPPVLPPTPTVTPTPDGAWLSAIPEGFPLGDGVPMPGEGIAQVRHDEGTTLTVCGTEVWSADQPAAWADVATATNADDVDPADGHDSRTLALYADAATARRVLASVAQALDACPPDLSGRGPETADRVGGDDAWVLHWPATRSGTASTLVTAARVGNALLVQLDDIVDGTDLSVEEQLTFYRQAQASVLAAMCAFAAEPCPGSTPSSTQGPTEDPAVAHVDEIPDSFPIDAAHFDPGSDGEVGTPSQDGDGVIFEPCGADALTMPAQDRLVFRVNAPELADWRELRTYPSADDAVTQMRRLRAAVADCPRQNPSDPISALAWNTHDVDTGYDSFATAMTFDQGLGGDVYLFTRVGRSILAVMEGGEFSRDSVPDALPTLVDRTNRIAPSMCLFTEAGCSS